jgi:Family of unknown function (DUF5670)
MSNAFGSFSLSWLVLDVFCRLWSGKKVAMFLILAVVLVILWIGGFTVFHVSGFLIHLLLIFALISVVMHFVTGRRAS